MKKLLLSINIAILFALVLPSVAHAIGVEMAVGAWLQAPSGTLGFKSISSNDLLDLDNDLNYGDETRPSGRLILDMPSFIPNVYLMYTPMKFEGNGSTSGTFNFGDQTIDGSVGFSSELKLDNADIALFYGIPGLETATSDMLNIDIGVNVRVYDVEARIVQGSTVDEGESFVAPVPMIYLAMQFRPIEELALEVEGRGVLIGDDSVYSLMGRLRWNAIGPLFLTGGYRYDRIDIDYDDLTVDTEFSGPFVEIGLAF